MAQHADLQSFVPGPGPTVGSHSTQYRVNNPLGAPAPAMLPHQFGTGNGAQTVPAIDDSQWWHIGSNNGGVGAALNQQVAVQQMPVLQWSNALAGPDRPIMLPVNPTRGGELVRDLHQRLAAPLRPQSVPGYIMTQSQVSNSMINQQQNKMYGGLKSPGINESQSTMCS